MKEGTLPVPQLIAPCTYCDHDVVPVQELSHLGGAAAAGVKPLLKFRFLLNSSPVQKKKIGALKGPCR